MEHRLRTATLLVGVLCTLPLSSCTIYSSSTASSSSSSQEPLKDLHILFTNDVHCYENVKTEDGKTVADGLSHASLLAYKNEVIAQGNEVLTIDLGDSIQGNAYGSVTQGKYGTDNMNIAHYDYAIFGNHEFDYGMDRLEELVNLNEASYLNGNIHYTGSGSSFLNDLAATATYEFDGGKVGFFALTTPDTLTSSTPSYFMENGEFVFDFFNGENGDRFYARAQALIDALLADGCDYVIALTHIGDLTSSLYNSRDLIAKTSGLDAVLDGHAHNVISGEVLKDKDGNSVYLTSTGCYFQNIGELTISVNGSIRPTLISDCESDESALEAIGRLNEDADQELNDNIGQTEVKLTQYDADGNWVVRARETNLGNFVSDAYRYVADTDIAFINGGGLRADVEVGEVTFRDILSVNPFYNTIAACYATGEEIANAIEWGARYASDDLTSDAGRTGGFLHGSGIRWSIDISIPSSVTQDEDGMFIDVEGERRVKDIEILQDGEYVALDMEKTYSVASITYLMMEQGDGFTMFLDNEYIITAGIYDYEALTRYIQEDISLGGLGGTITAEKYGSLEGRINII